ncbi:metal ABC transporter solute-binding protein, Zn/Mn family [Methanobacterium alcaliphilum]|uniref:metal ABC transporter solute-binding protein, Zn/Mn family n=1 Tax=Methanobacterium alcaliphilum TaxID=392018 RepID=UPI00200B94AF|nr:zinc ABC transporter substrate-binding protein [Methanobacterium alcaliphilum]MCK9152471.1 zinc ABC transporter substrate-binding protein [Methanobacterium alcaliphilum]
MTPKKKILVLIILLIALTSLLLFALTFIYSDSDNTQKITVAASIMPQKEFIEKIAGDKINVVIMVPSGADPHTYEPESSKLRQVSQADVYLEVGSGIEFELIWMDKLKSMNPEMVVVNSSKGINLIKMEDSGSNSAESHLESESDPHVWTSPKNAMMMVENTYEALAKADPANQNYYYQNKENYLNKLGELDTEISRELSGKNNSIMLVYHPAWGYFAKEFGLKQIAIEKEGKEPTPQTMADIIAMAKENDIKVIFISPQISRKNADTIARDIGADVVVIDPLSSNYMENMENLLKTLKNQN